MPISGIPKPYLDSLSDPKLLGFKYDTNPPGTKTSFPVTVSSREATPFRAPKALIVE